MLVRLLSDGKLFNCILHRQESFPWLLNADISSFCAKVIVAQKYKLFIHQAYRSSSSRELGKSCDGRGTFLRDNLNLASLGNDERRCWLADKCGRLEGFIKKVSLFVQKLCWFLKMLNFSRPPLFLDIVVHYTSVTRKEERDRMLPPRSLT